MDKEGSSAEETHTEGLEALVEAPSRACLIVMHGSETGRHYFLTREETVIGRSREADISLDQEPVSRQHALIRRRDDKLRLLDLDSKNGTYVNEVAIKDTELREGDFIQIGRTLFTFASGDGVEGQYHEDIHRLSTLDSATQVFNRQYFEAALDREINRCQRHKRPLSLLFLELDDFKSIQQTHGPEAARVVLIETARLLCANLRKEDVLACYGGEAFAVILAETDAVAAKTVSDTLMGVVRDTPITLANGEVRATIRVGATTVTNPSRETTGQQIIAAATAEVGKAQAGGPDSGRR